MPMKESLIKADVGNKINAKEREFWLHQVWGMRVPSWLKGWRYCPLEATLSPSSFQVGALQVDLFQLPSAIHASLSWDFPPGHSLCSESQPLFPLFNFMPGDPPSPSDSFPQVRRMVRVSPTSPASLMTSVLTSLLTLMYELVWHNLTPCHQHRPREVNFN